MQKSFLTVVTLLLLSSVVLAQTSLKTLNGNAPGQRFELQDYLRTDSVNVVVFYSRYSPACQRVIAKLDRLAENNEALNITLVDIDRPDQQKIDWRSPLVRQFNLRTLPHVQVYQGRQLESEGYSARKWLLKRWDEAFVE